MTATATATKTRRSPKPETLRTCRITPRPSITSLPVFTLTMTFTTGEQVETTEYKLQKWTGETYRLENLTNGKDYYTRLVETRQEPKCTCPGMKYHGHCKHHESLVALKSAGKLPTQSSTPASKPQTTTQHTACDFDNP